MQRRRSTLTTRLALAGLVWFMVSPGIQARELHSYAGVNPNGSLTIKGKTVHLYGIYIPETNRTCRTDQNPPTCGSRAVVALERKIDGFVRCEILARNQDRSLVGLCRVNSSSFDPGEDLSAYLLQQGWAVALPDAPFEYQTLEKIARSRGFGVWGTPVDNVQRR
jgi:endonuclease YncB( thermonuclease family)